MHYIGILRSGSVTTAWRVLRLWIEERPPIWSLAANKLNKQSWTADKGGPVAWGLGEGLTTPPCKSPVKKHSHAGFFLWRQNNLEVNYSPTRISWGRVSRGSMAENTKGDENRHLES